MFAFLQALSGNRILGSKHLSSSTTFRQRLSLWRWLIPLALVILTLLYETGPTYWVFKRLGFGYHVAMDTLIFGTIGPILTFLVLSFFERWLDERETSDLQAKILAQLREDARRGHQLTDEALQILFSAGALIALLKANQLDRSFENEVEGMETVLNQAMHRLRSHLEEPQEWRAKELNK